MPNLFSFLRGNRLCRALFMTVLVCLGHSSLLELEALNLLHYSPVNENGVVFGPPFPVVHNLLLILGYIEG